MDLSNLKEILKPQFVVRDANWLPRPAHTLDGAADLKLWCDESLTDKTVITKLDKVQSTMSLSYNSNVYINGQKIFKERKPSPKEWKDKKDNILKEFRVEEDDYRFTTLAPGEHKLLDVGFKIALPTLPEPFTSIYLITPRSGLAAKHKITVLNSPGLIDAQYRGDVKVCLVNHSNDFHMFSHGARVAQGCYTVAVSQALYSPESLIVSSLDSTERKGGFGHTGL